MEINILSKKLKSLDKKPRIIFPEGSSTLIQNVAKKLIMEELVSPVLVFDTDSELNDCKIDVEKISIESYDLDSLAEEFFKLRNGKVEDINKAKEIVSSSNYFSTMLLYKNIVDGYLGGITYTTGDTILPGLQIVKTKPGVKTISSTMVIKKESDVLFFSDIAINIDPDEEKLSEISIQTANLIKTFDIVPNIALLSFSTKGSAKSPIVDKVINAGKILDSRELDFNYDYEMQFDSAFDENIRLKKAPNTKLKGRVNGYIFPDLNSGNIGYKIAQRLGNYDAIGPIVTGFKKTINDLSRGANEKEIYEMSIITAIQTLSD